MGASLGVMQMASLGSSALSGVMSADSASSEGANAAAQARYNAKIAEQNAQLAEIRSLQIQEAANEAIQAENIETSQIVSLQRTQAAGAGIVVGQDTALDTEMDTIRAGTLDEIAIQRNADLDKWSAQIAANSSRNQAALQESTAQSAKRAGRANALSSLISGAGSVSSKWLSYT
tara:strand:- start:1658 stop:2182 length:525 start_codon:yes stop_codon:yes gene_type:complete